MGYLAQLAISIVTIYGGIGAGFLLQKVPKQEQVGKWLLFAGLNVLPPLMLIFVFLDIESFNGVNWGYIFLANTIAMLISMIIDWIMIRKKEMTPEAKGAELSAMGFMNGIFYPFPIIIGVLPPEHQAEGLLAASLFLLIQTVYRNTFGVWIGIYYGKLTKDDTPARNSLMKIFRDMILFPPTLGMILGIILRVSIGQYESSHLVGITVLNNVTMFIMLALVGLAFVIPKKEEWKEIPILRGIIARFGGGLLTVVFIILMPFSLITIIPLVIQSIAPPAVNNTAYAKYFQLDEILTSRFITILTLIALMFLPIEIFILIWIQNR
ncbi:MAG: AEC family transporter [Candidatus Heimdallarchaeaceae archaeon]|jgi:predicted permease